MYMSLGAMRLSRHSSSMVGSDDLIPPHRLTPSEQALRCAERIKRSNMPQDKFVRTTFLARIAHDIRAPAGVTAGALSELESALGPAAKDHEIWLRMIHRGIKRLLRLADRLSMVAELEDRPLELALSLVDLKELVQSALAATVFVSGRSAIQVEVDMTPDRVIARSDARWLEPALGEIIGNAIRFARRKVRVQLLHKEGRAELIVEDDGSGIATEALETIFTRFTHRSAGNGLGISLSIARTVIEGHGGRIRVESSSLPTASDGVRGARIVLELPTGAR